MLLLKNIFVSLLMISFGETFGERLKCIVGDAECERIMYNGVLKKYARGIPELEVLSIDPMDLKDISVSILGTVNVTLINGVCRGIENCKFVEMTSLIANRDLVKVHKVCNITVEGRFRISSCDPFIRELLGIEYLDGEGNGTLELNEFNMFIDFPYTFSKHEDGDIYVKSDFENIKYTKYEFKDIKFSANEIFFDNHESNNFVVKFLNENSSFMMTTVGRQIVKEAMQFYRKFCEMFFPTHPAKLFFKNDLEPLVTNN